MGLISIRSPIIILLPVLLLHSLVLAEESAEFVTYDASPLVIRIQGGKHSKWIAVRKLTMIRPGQYIRINEPPVKGTLEIRGVRVRYTPYAGASGRDHFSLMICESLEICVRREVVALIDASNLPPKATHLAFYLKEGEGSRWETPYLDDERPVPEYVKLIRAPEHIHVETDGTAFRVLNRPGWTGITGFKYLACDYLDQCIEGTAHVTVLPSATLSAAVISKGRLHTRVEDGLFPITTEPLINLQTGAALDEDFATIHVTYDSETPHSLIINGWELTPGSTIVIPDYPLSENGKRVSLDAQWKHPEKVPNGYIGQLSVQVGNYDIPNQVFPLFAGEIARRFDSNEVPRPLSAIGFDDVIIGMETTFFSQWAEDEQLEWVAYPADHPSIRQTGEGRVFTLVGTNLGTWKVVLANHDGSRKITRDISVRPVPIPAPHIIRKELQGQNILLLQGLPKQDHLEGLSTEWVLPDGTSSTTNPLVHRIGESEYGLYTYRVYDRRDPGRYKDNTVMVSNVNAEWPDWKLSKRTFANRWPIEVDYHVIPDRINYINDHLEHLSFQYVLPDTARITFRHLNRATVHFADGGKHQIIVRIRDDRGHAAELIDDVNLDELPPLRGAVDIYSEDPWFRVPLDVKVTPVIKQAMAGELVTSYRYFLDGKLVHQGIDESFRYAGIEDPGQHKVRVEIRTSHGRYLSVEDVFTAVASDPPACSVDLSIDDRIHSWIVETDCKENEGVIHELRWQLSLNADPDRYITFFAHERKAPVPHWATKEGIRSIRLSAINDKKEASFTTIDFNKAKSELLEERSKR